MQLKQLVLDLKQLSQKLTAAILLHSTSSVEGEPSLSLDSQKQQSHPESVQAASLPPLPADTYVKTCYSLEGLSQESQQGRAVLISQGSAPDGQGQPSPMFDSPISGTCLSFHVVDSCPPLCNKCEFIGGKSFSWDRERPPPSLLCSIRCDAD